MAGHSRPTTWTFPLDERTVHMSLVPPSPVQPPVFATPPAIRDVLSTFTRSPKTPSDVVAILDVSADLLEASVVHYEFAAVAVEKALQALELTIRFRVDQSQTAGMSRLIESLHKKHPVTPDLDDFVRDMLRLRNAWVGHPRNAGAYPLISAVGFLRHIRSAVATIADFKN